MNTQLKGRAGVLSQPLYAQVRERLLERIVSKEWQQGQVLPNEFDLARQFGVSIGTIRKAVEGLEAAKIVVRKQGRGTFVSRDSAAPPTEPISWFADLGIDISSISTSTLSVELRGATARELAALSMAADKAIIEIRRKRTFSGGAAVLDHIALPQRLFFDLDPREPLPGNLYEFYGDYFGVRAIKCRERIFVATADAEVASSLGLQTGQALLRIERTCHSSSGEAIEWRESFCILPKGLGFAGAC